MLTPSGVYVENVSNLIDRSSGAPFPNSHWRVSSARQQLRHLPSRPQTCPTGLRVPADEKTYISWLFSYCDGRDWEIAYL